MSVDPTQAAAPRERRTARARTTAREIPAPIHWEEGMLLAPQHFQWTTLRQEMLLHYHAAAVAPYHWGIRHLKIDAVNLGKGMVRVLELEAVMPDGLVVSQTNDDDDPDLSIDLNSIADIKQRPTTVHLAVVARTRGLALAERYAVTETRPIADENTGDGELPLTVFRPRLQLLAGDDVPAKYVSFPLMRVEFSNESFNRTEYQPPSIRIAPRSPIYDLCSMTAERLRRKASELADRVRNSLASDPPQRMETREMIHCLVGQLPSFEAVLGSDPHPFALYIAFCSLLGHVVGVGPSLIPPPLAPYDHNDIAASFRQVHTSIASAVDKGLSDHYDTYVFTRDQDEFNLFFEPQWAGHELLLGVRGSDEREVIAWMSAAVIAGRTKIEILRDRRVTGAVRKVIDAAADLVPASGVKLYRLTPDAENVPAGEELVVINPGGRRRPDQIVLYVRKS